MWSEGRYWWIVADTMEYFSCILFFTRNYLPKLLYLFIKYIKNCNKFENLCKNFIWALPNFALGHIIISDSYWKDMKG